MKNKEKAFSLIEVVMALAILGIAILPILSMYPSALKMTTKATTNEEWSRVSMSIVDYVKSRGYDNIKGIMGSNPTTLEKTYVNYSGAGFTYNSGAYTNTQFENEFLSDSAVFLINTKGIRLEDYKFSVYLEYAQSSYGSYDLINNKIVSNSTSSGIIYGIVKIREKNKPFDWDGTVGSDSDEKARDMKFIITPIEQWRN